MLGVLIYCSHALIPKDGPEMAELRAQCLRNNPALGITGALTFDGRQFFQVLEGPEIALDALFARIATDPRHSALRLLHRGPLATRRFPGWSMHFVDSGAYAHLGHAFSYGSLARAGCQELTRRVDILAHL
jgi:hypothetical protein